MLEFDSRHGIASARRPRARLIILAVLLAKMLINQQPIIVDPRTGRTQRHHRRDRTQAVEAARAHYDIIFMNVDT